MSNGNWQEQSRTIQYNIDVLVDELLNEIDDLGERIVSLDIENKELQDLADELRAENKELTEGLAT